MKYESLQFEETKRKKVEKKMPKRMSAEEKQRAAERFIEESVE